MVCKIDSEAASAEQIPADDAIHRRIAGAQVTQIRDGDLYIGRVLRAVHQFGQDTPLNLHGLVEVDHLAGASNQTELFGELAVDSAGTDTGIEQELQAMAVADAPFYDHEVTAYDIHGQLVHGELAPGPGVSARPGQEQGGCHENRPNFARAHGLEAGSGTNAPP